MSVEDGVFDRLSNYAGLSALVSARIYPYIAPQGVTDPYVVYRRISTSRLSNLGADTTMAVMILEIVAWSKNKDTAASVAVQIRAAFQRYSGTNSSIVFEDAYIINEEDFYDPETLYFHIPIDFEIWHRE